MVSEAEQFKEQDTILKEKVESRNKVETYVYSVRSTMIGDEKMKTALGDDAETVDKTTQEGIDWLESADDATRTKEDYDTKHTEIEGILMPLVQKAYQANMPEGMSGMPDGMPDGMPPVPPEGEMHDEGPSISEVD